MNRELVQLQYLTLGSLVVLTLLCGVLLIFVWLVMHFSQLLERVRATLGRVVSDEGGGGSGERLVVSERRSLAPTSDHSPLTSDHSPLTSDHSPLKAGDTAIVVSELNWMHGTGTVVTVGEILTLVNSHTTSNGLRWSARWQGHYLSFIPPESIRRHQP